MILLYVRIYDVFLAWALKFLRIIIRPILHVVIIRKETVLKRRDWSIEMTRGRKA